MYYDTFIVNRHYHRFIQGTLCDWREADKMAWKMAHECKRLAVIRAKKSLKFFLLDALLYTNSEKNLDSHVFHFML